MRGMRNPQSNLARPPPPIFARMSRVQRPPSPPISENNPSAGNAGDVAPPTVDGKPPGRPAPHIAQTLQLLRSLDPEIDAELQRLHDEMRSMRADIVAHSKSNFILERELDSIDEKIKLLVRNRITLQDVISSVQMSDRKPAGLLDPKLRTAYENVLYTLQNDPVHFAILARLVTGSEVQQFVQTVVFDFYGDQYDTRDERLLLSLFGHVLRAEFAAAQDMGSLLRANTAVTNMLSAYSRRGMGLSILSDILAEPLRKITSESTLDLELNPLAVYKDLIVQHETNTGQVFQGPRELSSEECALLPEVVEVIEPRRRRLIALAADILHRICDNVDHVPYGMRWISKKLRDLAVEFFPNADRKKVGSMIGGYIYLRFFNPVIVAPDALDFVRGKLSKKNRRNLILIAKLLQNLSNGLEFGEKEPYMTGCNCFIRDSREILDNYFDRLVDVEDLSTALALDKWLERTATRSTQIQISFNQLFTLHALLQKHIDTLCTDKYPVLRRQISQLGPAPKQLKSADNHSVGLELHPSVSEYSVDSVSSSLSRDRVPSTVVPAGDGDDTDDSECHPLYQDASHILLQFVRRSPPQLLHAGSLRNCLQRAKMVPYDPDFVELITSLEEALTMLQRMQLLPSSGDFGDPFDAFAANVLESLQHRNGQLETGRKRHTLVAKVSSTIRNHHEYLQSRLELYRVYLDNVRLGHATAKCSAPSPKKEKPARFKISQSELEASGVIVAVDPDVRKAILKKTSFTFTATQNPNQFLVTAHYNKTRAPMSPILFDLEELLDMQSNNQATVNVPNMVLNVNLLIHLLNSRFLATRK
ncbi:Ras-GAP domain-containing protein [Plasmodiophora brassicae]|uniref:Ras-GAP domain-containing protein n=1 Tax=Plasmodiophora brassicae TaxID=37360 RepID=A0A3P3Y0H6_PLABS|nr:unnamed protein product [Plasmodiophora brassicae]